MVVFRSDSVEHQVIPGCEPRHCYEITVWLYGTIKRRVENRRGRIHLKHFDIKTGSSAAAAPLYVSSPGPTRTKRPSLFPLQPYRDSKWDNHTTLDGDARHR
jgi:hypothetical protein